MKKVAQRCPIRFGNNAMKEMKKSQTDLAYSLGILAYIYGYPLVVMQKTMSQDIYQKAPINSLYRSRSFASPSKRPFVTPNPDTLYATAWLDLTHTAVRLTVPFSTGRYFTVQFLDMYTNTFHNIRVSDVGPLGGEFLIVGPNGVGDGYAGQQVIQAPTNNVYLVARVEVKNQRDLPYVIQLEEQLNVVPCNMEQPEQLPYLKEDVLTTLSFFKVMVEVLRKNPPPICDTVLLEQFKLIGIDIAKGFHPEYLPSEVIRGLEKAIHDGRTMIRASFPYYTSITKNHWSTVHPIGRYGNEFLARALVAEGGLAANVPSAETYLNSTFDYKGEPLSGIHRYVIHFKHNQFPKVNGFWSITVYDFCYNLVSNPINRFSIGTNTSGLRYRRDGSLEIFLQNKPPNEKSNWLPVPKGEFNLVLRMYDPKPSQIESLSNIPPILRVE